mmetsp:Transcript_14239/g.16331  ORF Transcript_14239/g.16331 Transcript_14239/m.16331 type:complete len:362 (+) Transcript_14239:87-1172(+)
MSPSLKRIFSSRNANADLIAKRIAARVQERNTWTTWKNHSLRDVLKFYRAKYSKIPSQEQLDIEFPVQKIDWNLLKENNKITENKLSVTWIGHATCLLQIDGFTVLTDPVFSKRCSPTQLVGPARYRPPACTVKELLEALKIDIVMVSHNHYDHLDYNSIRELATDAKNEMVFVVPLGLASWFRSNITNIEDNHSIVELDWHETHSVKSSNNQLEITPVPMQHWSSRAGYDADQTLWCGYSMRSTKSNRAALFSGDTGWFEGLHDIGKKYGPFDVGMIPIGAYEPYSFMKPQHNNPEDAIKMMQAVRVRRAVPIHYGTFQLTTEPYLEPIQRLETSMKAAGLPLERFKSWLIGETVIIDEE